MLPKFFTANLFITLLCLSNIFSSHLIIADTNLAQCLKMTTDLIDKSSGSLETYVARSKQTMLKTGSKYPEFINMIEDQKISEAITGASDYKTFKEILPEGGYFINHSVFQNMEPGIVKTSTGGKTSPLRIEIDYKGKKIGTNALYLTQALYDNRFRENLSLVPEKAEAVYIFMHGGGTKTTGNHVGISVANHLNSFNIATIAIDMPWHGEGPRELFRNKDEFFEWLELVIKQFGYKEDTPIFLGGHSMGGEYADMAMRYFPKDGLIKGVISLSPPVDPTPNSSNLVRAKRLADGYYAKLNLFQRVLQFLKIKKYSTEDEMFGSILIDGKNSPSAYYSEALSSIGNDWKIPDHNGDDYVKALFIWGAGDSLYKHYEKHVAKYIESLSNTVVKIYGERELLTGKKQIIEHLIFDHYAIVAPNELAKPNFLYRLAKKLFNIDLGQKEIESSHELEAFMDIRNFIQEVVGKEFKRNKPVQTTKGKGSKGGKNSKGAKEAFKANYINIIKEYSYNLAFREFVKDASITKKVLIPEQREEMQRISKRVGQLGEMLTNNKRTLTPELKINLDKQQVSLRASLEGYKGATSEVDVTEAKRIKIEISNINDLIYTKKYPLTETEITEFTNERKLLQQKQTGLFVPADESGLEGRNLNHAIKQLEEEVATANKESKKLTSKLDAYKLELAPIKKEVKLFFAKLDLSSHPGLKQATALYRRHLKDLEEQAEIVEKLVNDLLQTFYKDGDDYQGDLLPPPEMRQLFEEYETIHYPKFAKAKEEYQNTLDDLARDGQLGDNISQKLKNMRHIESEVTILTDANNKLEKITFEGGNKIRSFEAKIVELYNSDLYIIQKTSLAEILNLDYEEIVKYSSDIQQYLRKWKLIWKDRTVPDVFSLY